MFYGCGCEGDARGRYSAGVSQGDPTAVTKAPLYRPSEPWERSSRPTSALSPDP